MKIPRAKAKNTYIELREKNIPIKEAKDLARTCHSFWDCLTGSAFFTENAINKLYGTKLKGKRALNYIRKNINMEFEKHFRTSQDYNVLSSPYVKEFF